VQLVEFTASRPEFVRSASIETIRGLHEIRAEVQARQQALEADSTEARFERTYLRRVAVKLNDALRPASLRVDEAFGRARRILVRGEAGSGKTTRADTPAFLRHALHAPGRRPD
jgi:polynucleotide 5'-kinase involved in rRNA processing